MSALRRNPGASGSAWIGLVVASLAPSLSGCESLGFRLRSPFVKTRDERIGPGKMTPDAIQSEVMSFTDTFTSTVAQRWNEAGRERAREDAGGREVPEGPDSPEAPPRVDPGRASRAAHERKLASVSAALSIATSPSPVVALGDLITLVTLERTLLEDPSTEELFGPEAAAALLETYREQEAAAWRIGRRAFTPGQQRELGELIAEWRLEHPDQRYVSQVRLEDFAASRQQQVTDEGESGSLLSLVMLDPLAGLDPAKREVQESRMLAERAFFYVTRMPTILKWQAESLYQGFFRASEVSESLGSFAQVSEAADRISKAAERLPRDFAVEREAAVDQFFQGLAEQRQAFLEDVDRGQQRLEGTLQEFRETVVATDELAGSLTVTAHAIEAVAARFQRPDGAPEPEPGRDGLAEYQAAVEETGAAAERLTELAGKVEALLDPATLDRRTSALHAAVARAQAGAVDVIDHAFGRLLILVVVTAALVFLAVLFSRRLAPRRVFGRDERDRDASAARP